MIWYSSIQGKDIDMSKLFVTLRSRMVVAPVTPNPDSTTIIIITIGTTLDLIDIMIIPMEFIIKVQVNAVSREMK